MPSRISIPVWIDDNGGSWVADSTGGAIITIAASKQYAIQAPAPGRVWMIGSGPNLVPPIFLVFQIGGLFPASFPSGPRPSYLVLRLPSYLPTERLLRYLVEDAPARFVAYHNGVRVEVRRTAHRSIGPSRIRGSNEDIFVELMNRTTAGAWQFLSLPAKSRLLDGLEGDPVGTELRLWAMAIGVGLGAQNLRELIDGRRNILTLDTKRYFEELNARSLLVDPPSYVDRATHTAEIACTAAAWYGRPYQAPLEVPDPGLVFVTTTARATRVNNPGVVGAQADRGQLPPEIALGWYDHSRATPGVSYEYRGEPRLVAEVISPAMQSFTDMASLPVPSGEVPRVTPMLPAWAASGVLKLGLSGQTGFVEPGFVTVEWSQSATRAMASHAQAIRSAVRDLSLAREGLSTDGSELPQWRDALPLIISLGEMVLRQRVEGIEWSELKEYTLDRFRRHFEDIAGAYDRIDAAVTRLRRLFGMAEAIEHELFIDGVDALDRIRDALMAIWIAGTSDADDLLTAVAGHATGGGEAGGIWRLRLSHFEVIEQITDAEVEGWFELLNLSFTRGGMLFLRETHTNLGATLESFIHGFSTVFGRFVSLVTQLEPVRLDNVSGLDQPFELQWRAPAGRVLTLEEWRAKIAEAQRPIRSDWKNLYKIQQCFLRRIKILLILADIQLNEGNARSYVSVGVEVINLGRDISKIIYEHEHPLSGNLGRLTRAVSCVFALCDVIRLIECASHQRRRDDWCGAALYGLAAYGAGLQAIGGAWELTGMPPLAAAGATLQAIGFLVQTTSEILAYFFAQKPIEDLWEHCRFGTQRDSSSAEYPGIESSSQRQVSYLLTALIPITAELLLDRGHFDHANATVRFKVPNTNKQSRCLLKDGRVKFHRPNLNAPADGPGLTAIPVHPAVDIEVEIPIIDEVPERWPNGEKTIDLTQQLSLRLTAGIAENALELALHFTMLTRHPISELVMRRDWDVDVEGTIQVCLPELRDPVASPAPSGWPVSYEGLSPQQLLNTYPWASRLKFELEDTP